MDEAERFWLTAADAPRLLKYAGCCFSPRKMRLFSCACARQILPHLNAKALGVLALAEQMAEGHHPIEVAMRAHEYRTRTAGTGRHIVKILRATVAFEVYGVTTVADATAVALDSLTELQVETYGRADTESHLALVRDVFGNPFTPIAFAPWRTDTAVSLARQMYESREFSAMPILADALQDAGCDHDDVLNHCRDGRPHVRGCWVVDGVLGFS